MYLWGHTSIFPISQYIVLYMLVSDDLSSVSDRPFRRSSILNVVSVFLGSPPGWFCLKQFIDITQVTLSILVI